MDDARQELLEAAGNPDSGPEVLSQLAGSTDPAVLTSLIENPNTPGDALRHIATSPRIGVRKALLDSSRCPLVSSVAEDRLAFEGVDIGVFVDERSRRNICRRMIGTAHRAETELLFSDPSFRVLDCLRTLRSLFTIHGGKKRDRKLNRHDYLRFLSDFNARQGRQEALDLPFITLLTAIRLLGQDSLVEVLTIDEPGVASRTLRLLQAVIGSQDDPDGEHQKLLLRRWMARYEDWPQRLNGYLERKYQRRALRRRNRPPRTLEQAGLIGAVRQFNRSTAGCGARIHLPRTDRELQALGATMANCIGSEHNTADAVEGTHLILHAHPPGARRRGVTCQFNGAGELLQARGFANGDADPQLLDYARAAMHSLLSVGADDSS